MSTNTTSILYIEDNIADFKLLKGRLEKSGLSNPFDISHVLTLSDADNSLLNTDFDLVLLDLSLPDAHGLEGLSFLLENFPGLPIVVLTGNTDDTIAIDAIKHGAQDYLVKQDLRADLFFKTCNYAIERKKINVKLQEVIQREEDLNDELRCKNVELNTAFKALKQEKQRGEEKSQQINSFISMLVNDLKNPISAISSLIGLISEETLTNRQLKYITQIQRSSDSMLENILRIIDTQYAVDGVVKVNLQSENPYFTINSAIDKHVVEAIKRNIIIEINYKNNLPLVLVDKSTLNSAVSGIFTSIFNLTDKASRLIIGSFEEEEFLKINFLDKQIQLSDTQITELLAAEETIDINTNTVDLDLQRNFELGFVKQLLQMMGGDFNVYRNEKGKGTIFSLSLRLAEIVNVPK